MIGGGIMTFDALWSVVVAMIRSQGSDDLQELLATDEAMLRSTAQAEYDAVFPPTHTTVFPEGGSPVDPAPAVDPREEFWRVARRYVQGLINNPPSFWGRHQGWLADVKEGLDYGYYFRFHGKIAERMEQHDPSFNPPATFDAFDPMPNERAAKLASDLEREIQSALPPLSDADWTDWTRSYWRAAFWAIARKSQPRANSVTLWTDAPDSLDFAGSTVELERKTLDDPHRRRQTVWRKVEVTSEDQVNRWWSNLSTVSFAPPDGWGPAPDAVKITVGNGFVLPDGRRFDVFNDALRVLLGKAPHKAPTLVPTAAQDDARRATQDAEDDALAIATLEKLLKLKTVKATVPPLHGDISDDAKVRLIADSFRSPFKARKKHAGEATLALERLRAMAARGEYPQAAVADADEALQWRYTAAFSSAAEWAQDYADRQRDVADKEQGAIVASIPKLRVLLAERRLDEAKAMIEDHHGVDSMIRRSKVVLDWYNVEPLKTWRKLVADVYAAVRQEEDATKLHPDQVLRRDIDTQRHYTEWTRVGSGAWVIDRSYSGAHILHDDAYWTKKPGSHPTAFFLQGVNPNATADEAKVKKIRAKKHKPGVPAQVNDALREAWRGHPKSNTAYDEAGRHTFDQGEYFMIPHNHRMLLTPARGNEPLADPRGPARAAESILGSIGRPLFTLRWDQLAQINDAHKRVGRMVSSRSHLHRVTFKPGRSDLVVDIIDIAETPRVRESIRIENVTEREADPFGIAQVAWELLFRTFKQSDTTWSGAHSLAPIKVTDNAEPLPTIAVIMPMRLDRP